ncbi:hypothetical protein N5079_34670 [Planotetraspora sp. A-T 1434]|uniref:hypothetical protein n=1 Tax=Planotetraspora sp. A-T 1434 TaxID=2979219 RepID=UPI0021BFB4E0|nr:hypothetical protein [Planotetraspora sp. A-T 1434]MCT9935360.1 hypothetical protein [Planotetraspora sp. A-T 1434]
MSTRIEFVETPTLAPQAGTRAQTISLALFEGARLLRSPLLWGAAALLLGLRVYQTWNWAPDWSVLTIDDTYGALIVAAAALIAANLATTRERRHAMPGTLRALPVRAPARTSALLIAVPIVATAVSILVLAVHLVSQISANTAGRFDAWEALTGPVDVAVAAVLGVALGRWLPGLVAAPVAVFAIAVPTELSRAGGSWAALLPVIVSHDLPVELTPRPSATHLVYLLALGVLFAGLATARHGVRPPRVIAVATGLAVAASAGAVAMASVKDRVPEQTMRRYLDPAAHRCQALDGVTYCAYPGYAPWIPLWARAVRPVVAAIPPFARDRVPEIRQRIGFVSFGRRMQTTGQPRWPHIAGPSMQWGGHGKATDAWLGGQVAAEVTGLPLDWLRILINDPHLDARAVYVANGSPGCAALGQGRTLVALWLGGQAGPVRQAAKSWVEPEKSEEAAAERLYDYAERLVRRPDARERIWAHWDTLMNPSTTVEQALPLLGLRPGLGDAKRKACS